MDVIKKIGPNNMSDLIEKGAWIWFSTQQNLFKAYTHSIQRFFCLAADLFCRNVWQEGKVFVKLFGCASLCLC